MSDDFQGTLRPLRVTKCHKMIYMVKFMEDHKAMTFASIAVNRKQCKVPVKPIQGMKVI